MKKEGGSWEREEGMRDEGWLAVEKEGRIKAEEEGRNGDTGGNNEEDK